MLTVSNLVSKMVIVTWLSSLVSSLYPFLLRIISFMICKVINNRILFLDYTDVLSSEFSFAFACDTEG